MRKLRWFFAVTALFMAMSLQMNAQFDVVVMDLEEEGTPTVELNRFFDNDNDVVNNYISEMLDYEGEELCILLKMYEQSEGAQKEQIEKALEKIAVYVGKSKGLEDNKTMGLILESYVRSANDTRDGLFLLSLYKYFITDDDVRRMIYLIDDETYADMAIRVMAEAQGFAECVNKIVGKGDPDLKHKDAYAYAIGKLKMTELEDVLKSGLHKADDNLRIEVYNALLRFDDPSLKPFIEKGAKKLYKKKAPKTKMAGMDLLVAVKGSEAMPYLYKALKNKDREVRREALDLMIPYANEEVSALVVKKYAKKDATADVVRWIGLIYDKSQSAYVVSQLSSDNDAVVEEAIRTVIRMEIPEGLNVVKTMFGGKYQPVIKEALVESKTDMALLLKDAIKGNDHKKLCVLEILQERRCVAMYYNVVELLNSSNYDVKDAAYKALKNVVAATMGESLKPILEQCDEAYVADVQEAVKTAMKKAKPDQKDTFVMTLKHVKPEDLYRYYKIFAYFGTPTSVEKLVEAYNSGNNKEEALEAILLLNNKEYAPIIKALADKHDENSEQLQRHYNKLFGKGHIGHAEK